MIIVEPAGTDDLDRLVELETCLFREDAGRHDHFADVTWPEREGRSDFEQLVGSASAHVLVARRDHSVVGHLVGYLSQSSPSRQPVTYAVIRSMYVEADQRSLGVGGLLVERFVSWARDRGCIEAYVDSYISNSGAQRFYEREGFAGQSLSRVMRL